MEFARERELVHLRYELRHLLADGRRQDAAPLLDRLRQLAAQLAGGGELVEGAAPQTGPVESEIARWATTFDL